MRMRNVLAAITLFTAPQVFAAARLLASDVTVLVKPGAPLNGPEVFPTIQNAVDHAPEATDGGRVVIRITPGVYHERVWVPQNRPRMTFIGLGANPEDTVISAAKFAKDQGGTFFTETVAVNGEAFEADNITFENTAGRVRQALAISVLSDRAVFKNAGSRGTRTRCLRTGAVSTTLTATSLARWTSSSATQRLSSTTWNPRSCAGLCHCAKTAECQRADRLRHSG